jgi:hypothetical protein
LAHEKPHGRFIALLYGLASYVIFGASHAIGFVGGLVVPKTSMTGDHCR